MYLLFFVKIIITIIYDYSQNFKLNHQLTDEIKTTDKKNAGRFYTLPAFTMKRLDNT